MSKRLGILYRSPWFNHQGNDKRTMEITCTIGLRHWDVREGREYRFVYTRDRPRDKSHRNFGIMVYPGEGPELWYWLDGAEHWFFAGPAFWEKTWHMSLVADSVTVYQHLLPPHQSDVVHVYGWLEEK